MEKFISPQEVINDAFENNLVRGLFKDLYEKSPVGKQKFQEIAKGYGEEKLKDPKQFLLFSEEIGFSGIVKEYDENMNCWIETEYQFNHLFGIMNMPE